MKTVLIADDSRFMRKWLSDILVSANYLVIEEAENGQEAVSKFKSAKPDIVLMDVTMPLKNGVAALSEIIEICPEANVVMCSSMGQKSLILECLQLGAKDFIVKPYFTNLIPILRNLD
ncbi:response regulator [Domibacillus indicus]|uniref:response regulator n=1 Tax=Domibacillus indicus TaxID=1437523 RepID=UPI000A4ED8A2|nr:response regulator [Domibacillus indicus]